MNKARKQANFRKKVAIIFFALAAINILMKILGISRLDTSVAGTFSGAIGIQFGYYFAPVFFALIGWFFLNSSQSKALEAESLESSSNN